MKLPDEKELIKGSEKFIEAFKQHSPKEYKKTLENARSVLISKLKDRMASNID